MFAATSEVRKPPAVARYSSGSSVRNQAIPHDLGIGQVIASGYSGAALPPVFGALPYGVGDNPLRESRAWYDAVA